MTARWLQAYVRVPPEQNLDILGLGLFIHGLFQI